MTAALRVETAAGRTEVVAEVATTGEMTDVTPAAPDMPSIDVGLLLLAIPETEAQSPLADMIQSVLKEDSRTRITARIMITAPDVVSRGRIRRC